MCITEVLTGWDTNKVDPEFKTEQDYLAFYCSKEVYDPSHERRTPNHYPHVLRSSQAAIFRQVSSCPCLLLCITHGRIVVKGALSLGNDEGIVRIAQLSFAPSSKASAIATNDFPPNVTRGRTYIEPHFTTFEMDGKRVIVRYTGRVREEPKSIAFTALAQTDMHRLSANILAIPGAPRLCFCEWVESAVSSVVVMDRIASAVTESAEDGTDPTLTLSGYIRLHEAAGKRKTSDTVLGKRANAYVLTRGEDGEPLLVDFDCSSATRTV
ncbi:hypothetical protein GY45DRAFT_1373942 [Cubamyces sp. BRFM 1775]|nr:hypothetical protein GY45DRAFT_1373942 [Cubamyces sp. BRFM 1775]